MCVTCTTHTYISNSILEPKATEAKAKTLFRKAKFCKEKPKKFVEKENNQRIQKKQSVPFSSAISIIIKRTKNKLSETRFRQVTTRRNSQQFSSIRLSLPFCIYVQRSKNNH